MKVQIVWQLFLEKVNIVYLLRILFVLKTAYVWFKLINFCLLHSNAMFENVSSIWDMFTDKF